MKSEQEKRYDEQLGASLRASRKAAKLSQAEVAQALGVAPHSVLYWEKGTFSIGMYHLQKFARMVGKQVVIVAAKKEETA